MKHFFTNSKFHSIFFLSLFINTSLFSQYSGVDHWEMIIDEGQVWYYFPGVEAPSGDWNTLTFNEALWESGPSGVGYGDEDDQTVIDPVVSLFMRKSFEVADTTLIAALILYMDYDDAFVAYLNGIEIARANVSGDPPLYNTLASSLHEALIYQGGTPEEFRIESALINDILKQGENTLAIQVHNHDANSSDMTSIPFLLAGMADTTRTFVDPPLWFSAPVDYSDSRLPILSINTLQQSIPDEPKIPAWLSVIDHGQGELNNLYDKATGYDGRIGIEIRGESAQMFPKKSYAFETRDSLGENNNVELLGLPEENDWILYGPYSDKTLIKNVLTYRLTRDLGRYAARTKFCELFINGEFRGLYVLMEKIKQDKNRVDISKLKDDDVSGDQLTGGYILRVDKQDANDYPAWVSIPSTGLHGEDPITFQYFDPDGFELQSQQREYIKDWINSFESALNAPYYFDPEKGFKAYIDIPSFVDFMIINELTKNIDAYIFSTYLYKDRDSKGGRLHMGPVWDFNISFGNVDYNDAAMMTYGWMYDDDYRMYWFRRMMRDRIFSNQMNCRWHELRAGILSNDRILGIIDSLVMSLEEPIRKNYRRWPVLDTYVWPNVYIGNTYENEILHLKEWLTGRLDWMDDHIPNECVTGLEMEKNGDPIYRIFPNPFSDQLKIETGVDGQVEFVRLLDRQGRELMHDRGAELTSGGPARVWRLGDLHYLPSGFYIITIGMADGRVFRQKVVKRPMEITR